ncbi:MAG TPA: multidrug efflux RND transporter permease subunit [Anaeromyxobacter sp.]|nr:multidrug efflux RND transporter permease subunit [Anaeromyxobacter sp.]
MARFFIDRPVFAMALSIVILLAGAISALTLPVAQYPRIALPSVSVLSNYVGADAPTVEQSVTTPVEEQVNGVPGMLYMQSLSSADGSSRLNVTFELGTDPDVDAVQVQNRVTQANGQLPAAVLQYGITTTRVSPDVLMYLALHSPHATYDTAFVSNYATINIIDALKRVPGVGDVTLFSSPYGMRIWLRPDALAARGLTAQDVIAAVGEQNVQAPAGQVGGYPSPPGQAFQYSVTVQGRLTTPEQFGNIVVRALPGGEVVRVRDVARVELQNQLYSSIPFFGGKPGAVMAVYLTPEANALSAADGVRSRLAELSRSFPPDLAYDVVADTTQFVRASLDEVLKTLGAAILLVLLVVFLFLHSWRATLVPMLAIPVSLVGTFAAFRAFGFTVNSITLFGLVLAIGIVVDDAIVVVEAVDHHITESGLSPHDATVRAMSEVQGPVVAIALVLAAVFVPVAFLGGIVGQLYRQFALTVAVSVLLSALVALSLTPALCALLLRPHGERHGILDRFFGGFDRAFGAVTSGYVRAVRLSMRHVTATLLLLVALWAALAVVAKVLPTGFVPQEDQGFFLAAVNLPPATALARTAEVVRKGQDIALHVPGVRAAVGVAGFNLLVGSAQSNAGIVVGSLEPWDRRTSPDRSIGAILGRFQREARAALGNAMVVALSPPALPGLGRTGGFTFELEDRAGHSAEELAGVAAKVLDAARRRPELAGVYSTFDPTTPAYRLDVDRDKAKSLGVPVDAVFGTLQAFLGGFPVNDFNRFGRTYKVVVQADAPYRGSIDDVRLFYVRSAGGALVPLSTLVHPVRTGDPATVSHFNVYRSVEIGGQAAAGSSTGQALGAMEAIAAETLPPGYGFEWSGISFQERQTAGQAPIVLGLSFAFVFLVLAALYESWSIPFAVLLAVPVGVLGALLAQLLRGLENDVYAQIGLVLLVGLAAKNAILLVEFARERRTRGASIEEAAEEAGRIRLRPILMTSLAFLFGVVPLVTASGAGAGARHAIGTSVFGGMLFATGLGIFFVPALFAAIERIGERVHRPRKAQVPEPAGRSP